MRTKNIFITLAYEFKKNIVHNKRENRGGSLYVMEITYSQNSLLPQLEQNFASPVGEPQFEQKSEVDSLVESVPESILLSSPIIIELNLLFSVKLSTWSLLVKSLLN